VTLHFKQKGAITNFGGVKLMEISLFFSPEIDNFQFQLLSNKSDLGISAAKTRNGKKCYSPIKGKWVPL